MTKEVWTPTEEAAFLALQERRERVQAAMKAGVTTLVDRHFVGMAPEARTALFSILTKHADDWRDALAPFDSGVRPASPWQELPPDTLPRGFVRWPDGLRPVLPVAIDVRFRNGVENTGEPNAGQLLEWAIDGGPDDIVAWRYAD